MATMPEATNVNIGLCQYSGLTPLHFFVWVILATIPSFSVVLLIPLDKEFGKKA